MNDGIAFGARTTRNNNYVGIVKTNDIPNVGPGSYEAMSSLKFSMPAPDAVSTAAFGSSSERKCQVVSNTGVTVAPGSYNLDRSLSQKVAQTPPEPKLTDSMKEEINARTEALRIARGGSLYERKRTKGKTDKISPGPGQYEIINNWGDGHGVVQMQTAFGVDAAMMKSRQVGSPTAAVSWLRLPTAPTIPSRAQSNGYEEGLNGELLMVEDTNKHYTGRVGDNPGPGEYAPKLPHTRSSNAVNFGRGSLRPELVRIKPESKVEPRFGDNVLMDHEERFLPSPPKQSSAFLGSGRNGHVKPKQGTPGPGSYNAPSSLKIKPKAPEQLQFFGSTVQRFEQNRNVVPLAGVPGPGAYGTASCFDKKPQRAKKAIPSDRVGFQTTAGRTEFVIKSSDVGPGQYHISGMTEELIRNQKKQTYTRRKEPKHVIEVNHAQTSSQLETPGPATYFSNYNNEPPSRKGSANRCVPKKGDGGAGMIRGSVLRSEEATTPLDRPSSSFQGMGRTDMAETHRARLAASGSQLGHGVDHANRNDPNGINRHGPLTATESSRVYTTNPVLAYQEPEKYQLGDGTIPQLKGPDLGRSTGRSSLQMKKVSTSEIVGPGSYEAVGTMDKQGQVKRSSRGVMESKDARTRIFEPSPNPGPGEYNLTKQKGSFTIPTYNAAIAKSMPM